MTKFQGEITVKISILLLTLSGLILLFGNEAIFPPYYRPTFMGVMALLQAMLLLAPPYLFWPTSLLRQRYALNLQLALTLVFAVNNVGALGLYAFDEHLQYDKIVHFLNSFILLLAATYFLSGWFKISLGKAVQIAAVILLLGGFGWEIFELGVDWLFDTDLIGIRGHLKELDTILDIVFDAAGVCTAVFVVFLRVWNKKVENKEITFTWF